MEPSNPFNVALYAAKHEWSEPDWLNDEARMTRLMLILMLMLMLMLIIAIESENRIRGRRSSD